MSEETRLTTAEPSDVLSALKRAASDTTDIDKMERLLAMHLKLAEKDAEREFNMAFLAAQSDIRPIFKDANNPQTKARYAKLEKINEAIMPILQRHGLAISFGSDTPESMVSTHVRVTVKIYHANGYSEMRKIDAPLDGAGAKGTSNKTGVQAMGSSITYAQRYALKMIFNLSFTNEEDNDGEDSETITQEELEQLTTLCDETNADKARFLAYYQIKDFSDMTRKQFPGAITALKQKKAKEATT